MPVYTVQWIVGRALSDPAYRELMAQNPQAAWAGYELTPFDLSELRTWTPERIQSVLAELEQQIEVATFDGSVGFVLEDVAQSTNCDQTPFIDDLQKFLGEN